MCEPYVVFITENDIILADRVRYFKEDEKGVATMCRAIDEKVIA